MVVVSTLALMVMAMATTLVGEAPIGVNKIDKLWQDFHFSMSI